jgi:hypothetical protein
LLIKTSSEPVSSLILKQVSDAAALSSALAAKPFNSGCSDKTRSKF